MLDSPLMSRETQRKGDIGLTKAIARFTEMGFDVSLPITESGAYDMIVDDGSGLHRVQCKYSSRAKAEVNLRKHYTNTKSGYTTQHYIEGSYDWLYVYNPAYGEFLFKSCITGTTKCLSKENKL